MKQPLKTGQTSLSLVYPETNKPKEYAHVDKKIIHSHQKKVTVLTKRILTHVFAQIDRDATELKPYYQVKVSDLGTLSGVEISYTEMKKSFQEMLSISWLIEDAKNESFIAKQLLNTSSPDINCEYRNGVITLVLNPTLTPFLTNLTNYTNYQVKWYMTFSSWYSTRLYEILSTYKSTGWWYVELDEYRKLMDCEKKYPRSDSDMLKFSLKEPLEELAGTDCEFTYERVYSKSGRGRPSLVAVKFELKHTTKKTIPNNWKDKSPEHKEVIDQMIKVWKVEEQNFMNYISYVGMDGAKKLMKEWKEKENSNRRMDSRKLYCNASFVAEAKKKM
jgi:plasmid replication initiation protein